ncbi:MAG: hypothetical protein ACD_23C01276G0002 [uncultured bacterium]|nr:MAG: hypothetical protein ACD_23C01276G0002 [uncultured bacterium]
MLEERDAVHGDRRGHLDAARISKGLDLGGIPPSFERLDQAHARHERMRLQAVPLEFQQWRGVQAGSHRERQGIHRQGLSVGGIERPVVQRDDVSSQGICQPDSFGLRQRSLALFLAVDRGEGVGREQAVLRFDHAPVDQPL